MFHLPLIKPLSGLRPQLTQTLQDSGARLVLATDSTGYVREVVGTAQEDLATLAALAAANLAATQQIHRLAGLGHTLQVPQVLITEGQLGSVVMAGRVNGLVFIAVLPAEQGQLGLARLLLRHLAEVEWAETPTPTATLASDFLGTLVPPQAGELEAALDDALADF